MKIDICSPKLRFVGTLHGNLYQGKIFWISSIEKLGVCHPPLDWYDYVTRYMCADEHQTHDPWILRQLFQDDDTSERPTLFSGQTSAAINLRVPTIPPIGKSEWYSMDHHSFHYSITIHFDLVPCPGERFPNYKFSSLCHLTQVLISIQHSISIRIRLKLHCI